MWWLTMGRSRGGVCCGVSHSEHEGGATHSTKVYTVQCNTVSVSSKFHVWCTCVTALTQDAHSLALLLAPSLPPYTALLPARHPRLTSSPAADAIAPEGKAREGEEEDSPPQPSAKPRKMIPKQPVFNGKASALYDLVNSGTAPDIVKVNELIDAGIDLRYQVRSLVRADTIH